MDVLRHWPMLHQCPGCYSFGTHVVPEDGWIECECGEKRTVVDLRVPQPQGAVENALHVLVQAATDDDGILDATKLASLVLTRLRHQSAGGQSGVPGNAWINAPGGQ